MRPDYDAALNEGLRRLNESVHGMPDDVTVTICGIDVPYGSQEQLPHVTRVVSEITCNACIERLAWDVERALVNATCPKCGHRTGYQREDSKHVVYCASCGYERAFIA